MWKPKTSRSSYSHFRQSRYYGKTNKKRKRRPFILIKEIIQQEYTTIVNICAQNIDEKANASEFKGTDRARYNNRGRSPPPISSIDRSCT
jgi:hypothetical protein